MIAQAVLWHRLDRPGAEWAQVFFHNESWHLNGTAVFAHDDQPCRLDYHVVCDPDWTTTSGRVTGWIGAKEVVIDLRVNSERRWWLNDKERPEVEGCIDVDLNFSPSTNLLPIRRLTLDVGQQADVRAAWLRFPSLALEPLNQVYRRTSPTSYQYESAGGSFKAGLEVNADGIVLAYPGIWRAEAIG